MFKRKLIVKKYAGKPRFQFKVSNCFGKNFHVSERTYCWGGYYRKTFDEDDFLLSKYCRSWHKENFELLKIYTAIKKRQRGDL